MAKVRVEAGARRKFDNALAHMAAAHRKVDEVVAALQAAGSNDPIPIDKLVFLLSDQMVEHKQQMQVVQSDAGAAELAKLEMGDTLFDLAGAITETIARIDTLLAWVQSNVPASNSGGKKMVHFWELLPSGQTKLNTVTKNQLITAGISPVLQGFVDDRI